MKIIIIGILYGVLLAMFVANNVGLSEGVYHISKFGVIKSGKIEFWIMLGSIPMFLLLTWLYFKYSKTDEEKLIEILKENMNKKNDKNT